MDASKKKTRENPENPTQPKSRFVVKGIHPYHFSKKPFQGQALLGIGFGTGIAMVTLSIAKNTLPDATGTVSLTGKVRIHPSIPVTHWVFLHARYDYHVGWLHLEMEW